MRITKYEHATLTLHKRGSVLVIDPGAFLTSLTDVSDVVGVVITHEHPDHWDPRMLQAILDRNPGVAVFGPQGVADAAAGFEITVVAPGDTVAAGDFALRFLGGRHEVIHASIPVIENVGVLVDDKFYYPGDSYALPDGVDVMALAAPLAAPWLRVGDAMDFVLAVKAPTVFGTHDMTVSAIGRDMHRDRLRWAAQQHGGTFLALDPGDSFDL